VDVTCLECGASNAADRRFCRRCGSALDLVALSRPPARDGIPDAPSFVEPPAPAGAAGRAPAPAVPDPPRLSPRAPAVAESRGVKPAEPAARPPAVRPPAVPAEVEPGGDLCGQCGTANPPGRRFCRKCGGDLPGARTARIERAAITAPKPGLWQRMTGRARTGTGTGAEDPAPTRAARAAYRHSLDARYRMYRVLAVLGGAAILLGSVGLTGYNPITGARNLWDRFFPRYERIDELQAVASPAGIEDADFPARSAVDGDPNTEWAAVWTSQTDAAVEDCLGGENIGGADSALVVTLPAPAELTKIEVQPGLPEGDADRAGQYHPTRLELQYDDGTCEQLDLEAAAGVQEHRLDGPETTTVRVIILDAAPPADATLSVRKIGLGELRLYEAK
jgi:ribosomal protein L40E